MHRNRALRVACALGIVAGGIFAGVPSSAQEAPLKAEVTPESVKQGNYIWVASVHDCPVDNGRISGSVIYDGEVVGEFSAIGHRWRARYTVPYEAETGSYSVEVTCTSQHDPSVTYDYEPLTVTVTEQPKDLGLTVDPEVARPGETVTWTPDEPCPNRGSRWDRVYTSMYYLGADGTDEPEYLALFSGAGPRVDENGAWVLSRRVPANEGVYGMRLACVSVDVYGIPRVFEAGYEWSYLTVAEEDGAPPVVPSEPPPYETPVVPDESPAAPDSSEPGAPTGPDSSGTGAPTAPPATPVTGQPSFTG